MPLLRDAMPLGIDFPFFPMPDRTAPATISRFRDDKTESITSEANINQADFKQGHEWERTRSASLAAIRNRILRDSHDEGRLALLAAGQECGRMGTSRPWTNPKAWLRGLVP